MALAQLMAPTNASLYRLTPGGTDLTVSKTHLANSPVRFPVSDVTGILSTTTRLPMITDGKKVHPVWALSSGFYQMALTDDPLVPIIRPYINPNPNTVYFLDKWTGPGIGADGRIFMTQSAIGNGQNLILDLELGGSSWVNKGGPYGDVHPIGCSGTTDGIGHYYTWVDASTTSPATLSVMGMFESQAGTVSAGYLRVYSYNPGSDLILVSESVNYAPAINTSFTATVAIETSGYYVFKLSQGVAMPNNATDYMTFNCLAASITTTVGIVSRHDTSPQVYALCGSGVFPFVRVNGSATLIQNTTPSFYKGGRSIGFAATTLTEQWFDLVNDPDSSLNANSEARFDGQWEFGIYAYVKPRKLAERVQIWHSHGPYGTLNGDFADPWGISVVSLAPSMSTAAFPTLMVHNSSNWEAYTINPLLPTFAPQMNVAAFNEFVSAALRLGKPFHDNPDHVKNILDFLKRAGQFMQNDLLPGVIKAGKIAAVVLETIAVARTMAAAAAL